MRRKPSLMIVVSATLALCAPAAALAAGSAVDQYTEQAPTATGGPGTSGGGDASSGGGSSSAGSAGSGSAAGPLNQSTVDRFEKRSPDAKAAAALAQATAPNSRALRKAARRAQRGQTANTEPGLDEVSIGDAQRLSDGSQGMELALPLLLGTSLLGMILLGVGRSRYGDPTPDPT